MRLKTACVLSAVIFVFASPARADEMVWNPFLFNAICSTCGWQTPLTLEQADGIEILFGPNVLGPAIPVSPPISNSDFTPAPDPGTAGAPLILLPGALPGASGSSVTNSGSSSSSSRGGNNESGSGGNEYELNASQNGVSSSANDVVATDLLSHIPLLWNTPPHSDTSLLPNTSLLLDAPFLADTSLRSGASVLSDTSGVEAAADLAVAPEPTALILFGSGLALVSARLRRRRPTRR